MRSVYHAGNRRLQDRFDTRRLADRIEPAPAWKTREWSRDVLPEGDPAATSIGDVLPSRPRVASSRPGAGDLRASII